MERVAIEGVHFLLTLKCTQECDHCFVYGSPRAEAVFVWERLGEVLHRSADVEGVQWAFFEGGEPFLYFALLARGLAEAKRLGLRTGVVSNAYWATSVEDARVALEGLGAGHLDLLTLSSDELHNGTDAAARARAAHATEAARGLGIECSVIEIDAPGDVMFRGRAADRMADERARHPASEFEACPHEPLASPTRVHVDPHGNVHLCQGIVIGNVFETPLNEICSNYDAALHPVVGPLLAGGPYELARAVGFDCRGGFADACHLCFLARRHARAGGWPALEPASVYGES